jgi:predicted outer membrane repeat protein
MNAVEGAAGVATAQLSCSGGTIVASAAKELQDKMASTSEGVTWDPRECGGSECLVTLCGSSQVHFVDSIVSNISSKLPALCFGGSAHAVLSKFKMTNNKGPYGLLLSEQAIVILTDESLVKGNAYLHAVYATADAALEITGGTSFADNTSKEPAAAGSVGSGNPPADKVTNDQTITMKIPLIHNMVGISGAAVAAGEAAKVRIDGQSSFSRNSVTHGAGGAIAAWGDASLTITGGAILSSNAASSFGGALAVMERAVVNITGDVSFIENKSLKSICGAILVTDSAVLSASNGVVFRGNEAMERNCGGLGAWGDARVNITNDVLFLRNIAAVDGAAVVAAGHSEVSISQGVVFHENHARNTGGGIAVGGNATVLISDGVLFEANNGTYAGGSIAAWDNNTVIVIRNVTFRGNRADQGSGGAVSAGDLANISITEQCTLERNTASRGGALSMAGNSTLLLKDNILITDNSADTGGAINAEGEAVIIAVENVTFQGNQVESAGSNVLAETECKVDLSGSNVDAYRSTTVLWYRKDCILGETLVTDYCQPCPPLTYSADPRFGQCSRCPDNANCTGRDAIVPLIGHWHSHPYSTQVHPCPRSSVCGYNGTCAEGYTGHLCTSCGPGFGSYGSFRCGRCMTPSRTLATYLAAAGVLFLVASLLVHTTLKDNQMSAVSVVVRPSDIAKILVRHVQYLAIISTMSVQWPSALSAVFSASGWLFSAGGAEVVSLDCYFADRELRVPRAIAKVVAYLLAPVGIFLAVLCTRVLWRGMVMALRKRKPARPLRAPIESVASVLSVSFLVVLSWCVRRLACLPVYK